MIFSTTKVVGRSAVALGGTTLATFSYYNNQFKEWGEEKKNQLADWLKDTKLPDFGFQLDFDIKDLIPWTSSVHASKSELETSNDTDASNDVISSSTSSSIFPSNSSHPPDSPDQLLALTKQLLQVKSILSATDCKENIQLPSIVVIGSQSSGKSSLLESLVGHEFLPKRPIEITLIHTPNSTEEYSELPLEGYKKIKDFSILQRVLTEINLNVSEEECISEKPIDLRIYSPNVPDLNLIDLPGFIAVNNRSQPNSLKEKILQVCRKYIQEPNIILAVCSSDADLATSEALNESRKVDPLGLRTLGVLTKLDLIEPKRAISLITNEEFPLQLGYIGVICKQQSNGVEFQKRSQPMNSSEDNYLQQNAVTFTRVRNQLGIFQLKKKLIQVLEDHMAKSLQSIVNQVQSDLEEVRYQFKVQFDDRNISAESYLSQLIDNLKQKFKSLDQKFGRLQIRQDIRDILDEKIIHLCSTMLWNDASISKLEKSSTWNEDDYKYWNSILNKIHGIFTKSGIGRLATQNIIDELSLSLETILSKEPFTFHHEAQKEIQSLANELIRSRFYTTVDQVENTIKPYKFQIDFTEKEWNEAVERSVLVLEKELTKSKQNLEEIKNSVGKRKLRMAIQYVEETEKSKTASQPNPPFSPKVLSKAYEGMKLTQKIKVLENRLYQLRPGWIFPSNCKCSIPSHSEKHAKIFCPEPYFLLISDKIAQTTVMFIWIELLNEFFYLFPREVDNRLYYNLAPNEILNFARENPTIRNHLVLQEKKNSLEKAMEKLVFIVNARKNYE